jgi:hypothetical protein
MKVMKLMKREFFMSFMNYIYHVGGGVFFLKTAKNTHESHESHENIERIIHDIKKPSRFFIFEGFLLSI